MLGRNIIFQLENLFFLDTPILSTFKWCNFMVGVYSVHYSTESKIDHEKGIVATHSTKGEPRQCLKNCLSFFHTLSLLCHEYALESSDGSNRQVQDSISYFLGGHLFQLGF
jgi:hypothetical protein